MELKMTDSLEKIIIENNKLENKTDKNSFENRFKSDINSNNKKSKLEIVMSKKIDYSGFWDNFKIDWESLVIDRMNPILETARLNYWIPETTFKALEDQKDGKTSIYFVSTFKSVWDAFLLPYALTSDSTFLKMWNSYKKQSNPKYLDRTVSELDMPYIMMGSNMTSYAGFLKPYLEKKLKENSKILLIQKDASKREYVDFLKGVKEVLSSNNILLDFPERTRSRTGIPGDFDYSVLKNAIAASKTSNVKIIPVNIDYSGVLEMSSLVNKSNYLKSLYFGVINRRKMKFGRVYITMGRPIDVSPDMVVPGDAKNLSRRLAEYTKNACLNLTQIQPINIVSEAICRLNPDPWSKITLNSSYDNIELERFENALLSTMYDLDNHYHKFKRVNKQSFTRDIVKKSKIDALIARSNILGESISDGELLFTPQLLKESRVYANYIAHYIKKSDIYDRYVGHKQFRRLYS